MKNFVSTYLILSLVLLSCGATKEQAVKSPKKTESTNVSARDYPYIETFHKAVRLKTAGDLDGAMAEFNKCLAMRQNDDAVYYSLSQIYLEKGDKQLAASTIEKASALDKSNIWYIEEIAILYYEAQEFEKAIPEFKKLVDHEPKNLDWLYGYGDCLLRTGKTQEAIDVLDRAEDVLGINPALSIEKYNLYMRMKREPLALQEIERARAEYPTDPQLVGTLVDHYFQKGESVKAIGFLEELAKNDPSNGRVHLALGDVYRKQNKKKDAFDQYRLAFLCDDVDVDTKVRVLISIQETSYSLDQQAMDLMELAVSQHSTDAKVYSIKGDFLITNGDEIEALKAYKKSLEFEKNSYPIWKQVLILEYQNLAWDSLYIDSKMCLTYFTTQPLVYLLNGIGAIQTKHIDQAIESLELGKALVVNDSQLEAEFNGQLGAAYFAGKKFKEGQAFFDKAIELDPASNLIKNNYAYELAKAKINLEKALKMINQALAKSSNQGVYLDTRGYIQFQSNKFQEALSDFQSANELIPNEKDILDHLGDAYFKTGNVEKAVECWQKALDLGSKNKVISKKIESKTYYDPQLD